MSKDTDSGGHTVCIRQDHCHVWHMLDSLPTTMHGDILRHGPTPMTAADWGGLDGHIKLFVKYDSSVQVEGRTIATGIVPANTNLHWVLPDELRRRSQNTAIESSGEAPGSSIHPTSQHSPEHVRLSSTVHAHANVTHDGTAADAGGQCCAYHPPSRNLAGASILT